MRLFARSVGRVIVRTALAFIIGVAPAGVFGKRPIVAIRWRPRLPLVTTSM